MDDIFRMFNDQQIVQYYPLMKLEKPEDANNVVAMLNRKYNEGTMIRWGITLCDTNKLIGVIGFNDIHPGHKATVSYFLSPEFWGMGFMGEALPEVLRYGFDKYGFIRIDAQVMIGNVQSVKLLLKCGFGYEALLRDWLLLDGEHCDIELFSVFRLYC